MRRSSSVSSIPILACDRARSRSSARPVSKDEPFSGKKSTEKQIFKRSTSSSTLKKSTLFTPTLSALRRPTGSSITPASSRSRSKSPYKFGSAIKEKTLNDKKWVSEQHAKVCEFLLTHTTCNPYIIENMNPPSITTFVQVTNLLMKEIDPKINMNQTNYKEVVMNQMKLFRYPGTVSNSMLKTVYTAHSWPHVISMLGWLVDRINLMKKAEISSDGDSKYTSTDCVLNYFVKKYTAFNNNSESFEVDKAFQKELESIYKIDNEEIKKLDEKVTHLSLIKERQIEEIRQIDKETSELKEETEAKKYEMDTYYSENQERHIEINHLIDTLKAKNVEKTKALQEKKANITKLTQALEKQTYSYEGKIKLMKKIEELKHTLGLKKDSLAAKKQIKEEWDLKISDAKKRIEIEVFRLNNDLMKLTVIDPKLKVLEITESNYYSKNFKDELEKVVQNTNLLEERTNKTVQESKILLAKLEKENKKLAVENENLRKEIEFLTNEENNIDQEIRNCHKEIRTIKHDRENERKVIYGKIKELNESEPDIQSLSEKLEQLTTLKTTKLDDLEKFMNEKTVYFQKVYDEVMRHMMVLKQTADRVEDHLLSRANQVHEEETKILEDLMTLLPLGTLEDEDKID